MAILNDHAQYHSAIGQVDNQIVIDEERGHYHWVKVGWYGLERICGSVIHIDIIGDKIWIQRDGTEDGVAYELLERGIPKTDIVLAYHPPYKRTDHGFALGY